MRRVLIAAGIVTAAATASLVSLPVVAQGGPALGTKDPSKVTAGTYTVDANHTQILWQVNHLGFNDYFGIFGQPKGSLTLDPANPNAAKVEIEIPINSVQTNAPGLTAHLLKADFFEADKFPTATFKSTSVQASGQKATITGNLTLKGVTKPVTLDAEFSGAGVGPMNKKETVGFHATTTIKRSDFGVSYGIPMVPDDVKLKISVAFEK